jgi:cyanophycin synthetase
LLFLDGEFIDAIRRDPPSVTGDGRHTLKALVAAENRRRLKAKPISSLSPLVFNKECINTLAALGLRAGSVLEAGRTVAVKQAINENAARDNRNVKGEVHRDIIDTGGRLAKDLGVRLAGLDLIATDVSAPLSAGKCTFSEINTTPGIHHHYLLRDPATITPVAELVLEHMFSTRRGVMTL